MDQALGSCPHHILPLLRDFAARAPGFERNVGATLADADAIRETVWPGSENQTRHGSTSQGIGM